MLASFLGLFLGASWDSSLGWGQRKLDKTAFVQTQKLCNGRYFTWSHIQSVSCSRFYKILNNFWKRKVRLMSLIEAFSYVMKYCPNLLFYWCSKLTARCQLIDTFCFVAYIEKVSKHNNGLIKKGLYVVNLWRRKCHFGAFVKSNLA